MGRLREDSCNELPDHNSFRPTIHSPNSPVIAASQSSKAIRPPKHGGSGQTVLVPGVQTAR